MSNSTAEFAKSKILPTARTTANIVYTSVLLRRFAFLLLPLAFGEWQVAAVFTVLNGLMLAWRIRAEDAALSARRQTAHAG